MKQKYIPINNSTKVGVLGGGQLARMLIQKGHQLGLEMHVLCSQSQEPAAQVTAHWHKGDPQNKSDLKSFMKCLNFLTFESEFISGSVIHKINQEIQPNPQIFPDPLLMDQLQDRWTQKNLLKKSNIPTAPFIQVNQFDDLLKCPALFPQGFVLKKRMWGYDGYGTYLVEPHQNFDWLKSIIDPFPQGFIAEKKIPFKRELAIQIARSSSGDCVVLPLVETQQRDHRCFWVKGPVLHSQIDSLIRKLKSFLKKIQYVGIMAFELFDSSHGLIVNEIAPRVHNSGHYSLEGLSCDQFTLHLKCILGGKLTPVFLKQKGFAMVNLLGESDSTPYWQLPSHAHLHWYGKTTNRIGRKMGHLTALDSHPKKALKKALLEKRNFQI